VGVSDNGPGIPPEDQERIFEKFARMQRKGRPKGLGLGLAFCRLAVEAHGGRIWVESEPDQGSSFYFTLPT
jgi:signal transduction histidine kinase